MSALTCAVFVEVGYITSYYAYMPAMVQEVKATYDYFQADHLCAFNCTLRSILSTTLTEHIFAQIIDGLPTRDNVGYFPTYSKEICDNTASSAQAMEAARALREQFNTYDPLNNTVSSDLLFTVVASDR